MSSLKWRKTIMMKVRIHILTSCEIGLYVNTLHQTITNPSRKKENEPDLSGRMQSVVN